jgi:hypothetical protein
MPLPTRPPPDRNRPDHERYIDREAKRYADSELDYVDRLVKRLLDTNAFWSLGTARALNTSAKTVTVDLDPISGRGGAPVIATHEFKWGRPNWTAGLIVGKRVRVGWNPVLKYGWVIDTVNNE